MHAPIPVSPASTTTAPRAASAPLPSAIEALTVTQQAKLLAADGAANDEFGQSVCVSGSTAIVGAHFNAPGEARGAAYIFVRTGATWAQQAKLVAGDGVLGDQFACSVSVSGDTALVGAPFVRSQTGTVHVFVRTGGRWVQQAKLLAQGGAVGEQFGWSVSVSGDTAFIGANRRERDTGAVYVFHRSGTTWSQQARLVPGDLAPGDSFGEALSLDGDTALIGAPLQAKLTGAAYVFVRTSAGWVQQAKLRTGTASARDEIGQSVSLSGDTALVGSHAHETGAAYVFARSGGIWTEQATLLPADPVADQFACSVGLSGNLAVVGAMYTANATGAVHVFARGAGSWTEQKKLTAADATVQAYLGRAVSIFGDTMLAGAHRKGEGRGAAYVFVSPKAPAL
jgi:hypothetical protein